MAKRIQSTKSYNWANQHGHGHVVKIMAKRIQSTKSYNWANQHGHGHVVKINNWVKR